MTTTLVIQTVEDGNAWGSVNDDIEDIDICLFSDRISLSARKGLGVDFERGDVRVEISKEDAIKMCKSILFLLEIY